MCALQDSHAGAQGADTLGSQKVIVGTSHVQSASTETSMQRLAGLVEPHNMQPSSQPPASACGVTSSDMMSTLQYMPGPRS